MLRVGKILEEEELECHLIWIFTRRYRRRDLAIVTSLERVKAVTRDDHLATLSDRIRRHRLVVATITLRTNPTTLRRATK